MKRVRLLVMIVLVTNMLVGCSTKERLAKDEQASMEDISKKEKMTNQLEEATMEKETSFSLITFIPKGKTLFVKKENEVVVPRIKNRTITKGEKIYANELIAPNEMELDNMARGSIVYGLMECFNLDLTFINQNYNGENSPFISEEEDFFFINDSGKEYYIEYVTFLEDKNCYLFDIYPNDILRIE